jgi:hypothetical protein
MSDIRAKHDRPKPTLAEFAELVGGPRDDKLQLGRPTRSSGRQVGSVTGASMGRSAITRASGLKALGTKNRKLLAHGILVARAAPRQKLCCSSCVLAWRAAAVTPEGKWEGSI